MTRNLKNLGLALVAVFALGAAVTSAASAESTFTTGSENTILEATALTHQVFKIQGGWMVTCKDLSLATPRSSG